MEYTGKEKRKQSSYDNNLKLIMDGQNKIEKTVTTLSNKITDLDKKITDLEKSNISSEETLSHVVEYVGKCEVTLEEFGDSINNIKIEEARDDGVATGRKQNKDSNNRNLTLFCTVIVCAISLGGFFWSGSNKSEKILSEYRTEYKKDNNSVTKQLEELKLALREIKISKE